MDYGFATLSKFFELSPWILLLLVPAITMRTFSDEFRAGTYEILLTKPLSHWQLLSGKYFGALLVILLALLPTVVYVITISSLSSEGGIDWGATIGSYLGLFFLSATFAAIGLACSSFTSNAVVAFLIGSFACFLLYYGFNGISKIPALESGPDYYIEMLGIDFHFKNISRGVVDTRDLAYFFSLIYLLLHITYRNLKKKQAA